jgi:hypothetical protein
MLAPSVADAATPIDATGNPDGHRRQAKVLATIVGTTADGCRARGERPSRCSTSSPSTEPSSQASFFAAWKHSSIALRAPATRRP